MPRSQGSTNSGRRHHGSKTRQAERTSAFGCPSRLASGPRWRNWWPTTFLQTIAAGGGAGIRHGRDDYMADMRAVAEVFPHEDVTSTVIATRGSCRALTLICASNCGPGAGEISAEVLSVVELNADNRVVSRVAFDLDDINAASRSSTLVTLQAKRPRTRARGRSSRRCTRGSIGSNFPLPRPTGYTSTIGRSSRSKRVICPHLSGQSRT